MRLLFLNIIFIFSLSCIINDLSAQVSNDDCLGAIDLGALTAPTPCPSTTGVTQSFSLNNTGAVAEVPYTYLVGCQPSGDMAAPAADVWYTFTASANIIDVNITGGLNDPSVGLYEGPNCSNLIGRGCANGSGGSLSATFQPLSPGNLYYFQISGGNVADQGSFTMSITSYNNCDPCLITSALTSNPPSNGGFYNTGETVSFCFTVTEWSQTAVNWIHAVIPTFGPGWDLSTLVVYPPASCDGVGSWDWYTSVTGDYTGITYGPGFYYESTATCLFCFSDPADPGDNYGDNCTGSVNWQFCWDITVASCPPNTMGTSLNISIDTYGDAETGSWASMGCELDPIYNFFATAICCEDPLVSVDNNVSCYGGNDGQATSTGQGVTPFTFSWNTSPVQNTATAAGLSAGTYTVTVIDSVGCFGTISATITEPSTISLSISSTPSTCGINDGTATVSASGGTGSYTYSWSPSGGNAAVATGLAAGIYTVTVYDSNGCIQTDIVTVTSSGGPSANITSSINVGCFGGSDGVATVTASGGTTPYTYSWSPSGGNGVIATGLVAGFYTITVTDAGGCSAVDTVTITEPSLLSATVINSTDVLCYGSSDGTATVSVSTGTSPYTYFWSPSGGNNATATGLLAGSYTVNVTDANGCSGSDNVTITEPSSLILSLNSTPAVCGNLDGTATVTASGGIGSYTYFWDDPGSQITAIATGLPGGTYTVNVTDANGCLTIDSVIVNETSSLSINFTTIDAACSGSCDGSATANPSGGTAPYTYQWNDAGSQTTPTATGLCGGTYSVIVSDVSGCADTNTVNINEPTILSSSFSSTDVICYGQCNGSATVTTSGGTSPYTSLWDDPGSQATSTATGLCPGNYTYTLTDANGCIDITNVTINEPPLLTLNFDKFDALCYGSCNGYAVVVPQGGTGSTYTYLWSPPPGTGQGTASAGGLCTGTYDLTVTDSNSCTASTTFVIDEPPDFTIDTSSTDAHCGLPDGDATVTVGGATPGYTYQWDANAGYQTASIATGLKPETYNVTVTDFNGCVTVVPVTVGDIPGPNASAVSTPATCEGDCDGTATASATGGAQPYTYQWDDPDNQTGYTATGLCAVNYSVIVTDINGCPDNVSIGITHNPSPNADFSMIPQITTIINPVITFTNLSSGAVSYEWDFGDTT
ncbi:MAG: hypothetical protein ABII90_14615, partial [Bacteroidota bacterium]